jgi:hypothetical protein
MSKWIGIANDLTEDAVVGLPYAEQTCEARENAQSPRPPSVPHKKKRHPFVSFLRFLFVLALIIASPICFAFLYGFFTGLVEYYSLHRGG